MFDHLVHPYWLWTNAWHLHTVGLVLLWQQSCSNTRLFARPATQEVSLHDSLPWVCDLHPQNYHMAAVHPWAEQPRVPWNQPLPRPARWPQGTNWWCQTQASQPWAPHFDFRGSSRDEPRHERAWAKRTSSCKHTYVVRWSTQFRACITRNFHVNERPIDKTEKTYLTLWHTRCIWRVAK